MSLEEPGKLDLISSKNFTTHFELVRVVDFLNKSLKHKGIMFGISKDNDKGQMNINIYEFR